MFIGYIEIVIDLKANRMKKVVACRAMIFMHQVNNFLFSSVLITGLHV